MTNEIWQEIECPAQKLDIDVFGHDILAIGDVFDCPLCGEKHAATSDFPGETSVKVDDVVTYRPIPRDQAEKAAWLDECGIKA